MNVHIVFGESGSGTLKEALRQLNPSYEWKIISIPDLFSVGPIWQLHNETGFKNRLSWLLKYLLREKNYSYFSLEEYEISFRNSVQKIKDVDNSALITIWTGENAHDQTGFRFISYLLQGKEASLQVINASKAYQNHFSRSSRYHFVPFHLGEVNPDQLKILLADSQLFQTISNDNRNRLIQEWINLANSKELLRIWKNGEIKSVSENHYDKLFIRFARKRNTQDFIKAARLIGEVLGHLDQVVGDEFLEYRLLHLIQEGMFLSQGSLDAMRNYSVQLK